jgi:chaperonin GroES
MKELKARGTFVIIKPDAKKDTSEGGIILAEETKQRETDVRGVVISVGPGWNTPEGKVIPLDIKVGDKVFFHPGASVRIYYKFTEESKLLSLDGKEIKSGGIEELFVLKEQDCMITIHED